jgi:hypothetical protein
MILKFLSFFVGSLLLLALGVNAVERNIRDKYAKYAFRYSDDSDDIKIE